MKNITNWLFEFLGIDEKPIAITETDIEIYAQLGRDFAKLRASPEYGKPYKQPTDFKRFLTLQCSSQSFY